MAFLQLNNVPSERVIHGTGPTNAKIAIVGDAPGQYEHNTLKPWCGPAGTVLEQCMHSAGMIRSEVYLTYVVKTKCTGDAQLAYYNDKNGTFTTLGRQAAIDLLLELQTLNVNVIVACGSMALAALTGASKILKFRGYVFESVGLNPTRKVIACVNPAMAMRGMYIYRHLIAADLRKAKALSMDQELKRPDRKLIYDFNHVEEVLEWLEYYETAPVVAFDIEVLNYEMSCISFSSEPNIAISIPLAGRWSDWDELQIFRGIQRVLGNPTSIKVGQNAIFDCQFLLAKCHIEVRGPIHDTMIAHSIMYPEMQKGLGFLGSLYCGTQRYWKDKVNFKNIKEDN